MVQVGEIEAGLIFLEMLEKIRHLHNDVYANALFLDLILEVKVSPFEQTLLRLLR